ncbi:MAG: hypothetical protein NZM31_02345 [Gemmatales bacterium]|nr:hypothetical protein [Gemmatales bacterium]MDW8385838.1 hypothetical protein [Gemmatales bacterium]
MMAVSQCPTCREDVRIPRDLFGSLVRCPICYCEFVAPERLSAAALDDGELDDGESDPRDEDGKEAEPRSGPDADGSDPENGFCCPSCGSTQAPGVTKRISTAGWITFAVLLVTFWPLFWIGLLINEEVKQCRQCRRVIANA